MFYYNLVVRMKRKKKMDKLREFVRPKVRECLINGMTMKTKITKEIVKQEKFRTFKDVYDIYRAVLLEAKSQA